jgi:hypothetical protein
MSIRIFIGKLCEDSGLNASDRDVGLLDSSVFSDHASRAKEGGLAGPDEAILLLMADNPAFGVVDVRVNADKEFHGRFVW